LVLKYLVLFAKVVPQMFDFHSPKRGGEEDEVANPVVRTPLASPSPSWGRVGVGAGAADVAGMTSIMVARARALRRAATPPEVRLWSFLRTLRAEGYHFRRQAPFLGYVLDFVCYRSRLVIEVDGAQHGMAVQMARDAERDARLAREGFCVVRFLAPDVLGNLEGVACAIRQALAACSAPTPALPQRGGGRRT
jgi:very-short-patch-repair endonuclease